MLGRTGTSVFYFAMIAQSSRHQKKLLAHTRQETVSGYYYDCAIIKKRRLSFFREHFISGSSAVDEGKSSIDAQRLLGPNGIVEAFKQCLGR